MSTQSLLCHRDECYPVRHNTEYWTYHVDFWDGVNAGDIYAHSHNDWGTWKKEKEKKKESG